MNKHHILFFVLIPFCFFSMERKKETIFNRIARSAEKKDVNTDLTFEKALDAIEKECEPGHLKDWTRAFARTYLRMEKSKNYKQLKEELDSYCQTAEGMSVTFLPSLVKVLKRAIDNWDTENPHNIFKYIENPNGIKTFIQDDYFLGLQDPTKAKKQ